MEYFPCVPKCAKGIETIFRSEFLILNGTMIANITGILGLASHADAFQ